MSEPSSGVPGEIADAEVDEPTTQEQPAHVELDLDEEKLEAWDEVKGDYEVEPGGAPVPNSMDQASVAQLEDEDVDGDGEADGDHEDDHADDHEDDPADDAQRSAGT